MRNNQLERSVIKNNIMNKETLKLINLINKINNKLKKEKNEIFNRYR